MAMMVKINKKGFVFSFISLVLVLLIFGFGSLFLYDNSYDSTTQFKESRILFLNNEIVYFKDTYLPNTISFSFYNTILGIINYSASDYSIESNYSKLNELIFEGLINGSFDGNPQLLIENKTINYFTDSFINNFNTNYMANFSYDIIDVSIYEKDPYRVTLLVNVVYNITTDDDISSWNFIDEFEVTVPLYDLYDPLYLYNDDKQVPLKPIEYYKSNLNWTMDILNETIANGYSVAYLEPVYRYTIGSSFLMRLLNSSGNSYKDVVGFWHFDYDNEMKTVFDNSYEAGDGKFFGNTQFLFDFDNFIWSTVVRDTTSYGINATITGADCNYANFNNYSCMFSLNDHLDIDSSSINLTDTNSISISMWINPNRYNDSSTQQSSHIFSYGENNNDSINLKILPDGRISLEVGNHVGSIYYQFNTSESIELDKWSHLVVVFDGDKGTGSIYIDGNLANTNIYTGYQYSRTMYRFLYSNTGIRIGDSFTNTNSFSGMIDELAFYPIALDELEISSMFRDREAKHIDYKKSLYGTGIEFDGIDDYLIINDSNALSMSDEITVSAWIKPYSIPEGNDAGIVGKSEGTAGDLDFGLTFHNDNQIWAYINGGGNHVSGSIGEVNRWYYIVMTYDRTNLMLYINGNLIDVLPLNVAIVDNNGPLKIGQMTSYFNGMIDEVKIYNRSLSSNEIKNHYYNYESFSKGCCNYLSIVNPNALGYNTTSYNHNVSYSSRLFYEHYFTGKNHDLTIYKVNNITNDSISNEYYNLNFDICMMQAYSVYDYDLEPTAVPGKIGSAFCENLVKWGVY